MTVHISASALSSFTGAAGGRGAGAAGAAGSAAAGTAPGACGACSVLLDGQLVKSCLSLAVQADGCRIQTVEGLAQGDQLHPLQESFMNCGGLQCGYCTPGFLMASCALLEKNSQPSEEEIRSALSGNLCRCTGYTQIVESVQDAARKMHGH